MSDAIVRNSVSESRASIESEAQDIIDAIVGRVPSDVVFDSHFVIEQFRLDSGNWYAKFCAFSPDLSAAHSRIAISLISKAPCVRFEAAQAGKPLRLWNAHSLNVNNNPSDNALWIRKSPPSHLGAESLG